MRVFTAKEILSSIPAYWSAYERIPLDPFFREELKKAELVSVAEGTDGVRMRRTELGDRFLHHLQKQDQIKVGSRTDHETIPDYADIQKAVEIFKLIEECITLYVDEWYTTMSAFLDDKKDKETHKLSEEELKLFNEFSDKMNKAVLDGLKAGIKKRAEENPFKTGLRLKKLRIKKGSDSPFRRILKGRFGNGILDDILNTTDANISGFFVYGDSDDDDDT